MNPASSIRVLCVGTIPGARPATCDPAIDLVRTTAAALTRYERERTDEARAEIVLLPDEPYRFTEADAAEIAALVNAKAVIAGDH